MEGNHWDQHTNSLAMLARKEAHQMQAIHPVEHSLKLAATLPYSAPVSRSRCSNQPTKNPPQNALPQPVGSFNRPGLGAFTASKLDALLLHGCPSRLLSPSAPETRSDETPLGPVSSKLRTLLCCCSVSAQAACMEAATVQRWCESSSQPLFAGAPAGRVWSASASVVDTSDAPPYRLSRHSSAVVVVMSTAGMSQVSPVSARCTTQPRSPLRKQTTCTALRLL